MYSRPSPELSACQRSSRFGRMDVSKYGQGRAVGRVENLFYQWNTDRYFEKILILFHSDFHLIYENYNYKENIPIG